MSKKNFNKEKRRKIQQQKFDKRTRRRQANREKKRPIILEA